MRQAGRLPGPRATSRPGPQAGGESGLRFVALVAAALVAIVAAACAQGGGSDADNLAASDPEAVPADSPETTVQQAAAASSSEFEELEAGSFHTCGLRTDDTIVCWGDNSHGQTDAPAGQFIAVTAGEAHSCGLRTDGTITCWGGDEYRQTDNVPEGLFSAVTAGRSHTCGLRTDSTIECWPSGEWFDPPGGLFSAVAAGDVNTCGLRTDSTIACWGPDPDGRYIPLEGLFGAVTSGKDHMCGLRTDDTIACWGTPFAGQTSAPSGHFRAITSGAHHSCGLRTDGTIACWGNNSRSQSRAPAGQFRAVAAGHDHSCGLRTDGTIACWGTVPDWLDVVTPPPRGVTFDDGSDLADPEACQPRGQSHGVTAGFPLPVWALSSTGTLRVAVLFVDFPNAAARHSTQLEADLGLPYGEEYLEASSYGQLDVEFAPLHRWLRAAHNYEHYLRGAVSYGSTVGGGIVGEAIGLADPEIDFTGFDAVMVVFPSSHFSGGETWSGGRVFATDEGSVPEVRANTFLKRDAYRASYAQEPGDGTPDWLNEPQEWGPTAAHELLHKLGLLDLFPYVTDGQMTRETALAEGWMVASFGPMLLEAFVPANDEALDDIGARYRPAPEMLAWSRWQLGWLDAEQVQCLTSSETSVTLAPVANPGSRTAMAAVPLSGTEVIVAESRRGVGPDSGTALLDEGVLVYTVDSALGTGELPIRVAGDTGTRQLDEYPLLGAGESVTVRGYEITVVADDGATHTVTIARIDSEQR